MENWRVIADYPAYAVSDLGRVKRIVEGRGRGRAGLVLAWRRSKPGAYPTVALAENGVAKNWFVHRLVAHAFLGPCPDGHEVNHMDGNKQNPALDNLEYVTRAQNIQHAFAIGLVSRVGSRNNRAKLTERDVASIRGEYTGAYGQCAAIARRFNVSHASVQDIIHGRHWTLAEAARGNPEVAAASISQACGTCLRRQA